MLKDCRQCKWYLFTNGHETGRDKHFCFHYDDEVIPQFGCEEGENGRLDNNELKEEEGTENE